MKWLIVALLALFPLGQLERLELVKGVAIYAHDLIAACMLLIVLVSSAKLRKLPQANLTKPILLFSLAGALSLAIGAPNVSPSQAMIGSLYLVRWISLSGIYFYVLKFLRTHKRIKILGRNYSVSELLLISGLTLTAFGLIQYLLLPDMRQLKWLGWDDHYFRLLSTLLDPNFTGILVIATLFLALGQNLSAEVKFVSLALTSIALLLTYSRASYLAFLSGGLVYLLMKKRVKIGIPIGIAFLSALLVLPRPGGEGVNLTRLYSIQRRAENWSQAITITKENPLVGVGFNLLRYRKFELDLQVDAKWEANHAAAGVDNSFLFVFATTGVIGLIAYLWLLANMIKVNWRQRLTNPERAAAGIGSFVAIIVHSFFNNTWFYPQVLIWIWIELSQAEASHSA